MILLAVIAASVAAVAAVAMWLYRKPVIRAQLAVYLAPVWAAERRHRGRLIVATGGLATVLTLIDSGFFAAAPIAVATFFMWLCRAIRQDADEDAKQAQRHVNWLTGDAKHVADTRNAYGDALNHILRLTDLDAVKAVATTALETGSYPGDLAASRAGHEACELELRDTKADLDDARSWLPGEERPA